MKHNDKPKLLWSKDYVRFRLLPDNREINTRSAKYKNLVESIRQYGFDPGHPIKVRREGNFFYVIEGQHRLYAAKELGIEFAYVITNLQIPITVINAAVNTWKTDDYGNAFSKADNDAAKDYQYIMGWATRLKLGSNTIAAVYVGNVSLCGPESDRWRSGNYRIKTPAAGDRACLTMERVCDIDKRFRKASWLTAIFAMQQLDDIDDDRFLSGIQRAGPSMVPATVSVLIFDQLERIYNYGRKAKRPVAFEIKEYLDGRKFLRPWRESRKPVFYPAPLDERTQP